MKKIGIILITFLLLVGCMSQSVEDKQFDKYNQIKNNLIQRTQFDNDYPFNLSLIYNKIDNHFRYDIVIDQPSQELYSIMAVAYTDEDETKMCPVIGIFDEDPYNLKVDYIDKSLGYYKGIQLSGTTLEKQSVKVYVCYYTNKDKTNKIEKYIEVKP